MSNCERKIRRQMARRGFLRAREGVREMSDMEAVENVFQRLSRWAWVPILGPLVRWYLGRQVTA